VASNAVLAVRLAVAAGALLLVLLGSSAAAADASAVEVWFLKGEQMSPTSRPGTTVREAVRALLRGPTAAEKRAGVETYVPATVKLRSVTVANGLATVDLSLPFVLGKDAPSLLARLSQLVHTATGPEGVTRVRLLVEGGTPVGMFPGAFASGPITEEYLATPNVPVPKPPAEQATPVDEQVRAVQQRLADLGYLLPGDVDGQAGPATESAVLAFQKWEGLERDGEAGPQTLARLRVAKRPTPVTRGGSGKRSEVLLDRQVALAIENDRVVRTLHVSTGAPSSPTPPGDFKVYAKIPKWWSVPFREWLLWAVPFNGGIAFHELAEVPPYAASHGCVRERFVSSKWMYDFARVGMPVKVLTRSR
jgi:lipoprotein-anchoring transpeptidase ErfK/SrfK